MTWLILGFTFRRERDPPLPPPSQPGASPKVSINPPPPPPPPPSSTINLAGRDPRDSPSDTRETQPQPSNREQREREREREMAVVSARTSGRAPSPTTLMSAREANQNPIILADLDPHSLPPELRNEAGDWFCIFNPSLSPSALTNPKARKNLDIALLWTFSHATYVVSSLLSLFLTPCFILGSFVAFSSPQTENILLRGVTEPLKSLTSNRVIRYGKSLSNASIYSTPPPPSPAF